MCNEICCESILISLYDLIRKKRYFILRKDIHSLSYFPSAESMTLLGSIKLERGSSIEYVHPNDVGMYFPH